jgi:hypothetical protein
VDAKKTDKELVHVKRLHSREQEPTDIDADKRDLRTNSLAVIAINCARNRHDELANDHAQGTPEEQGTASDFFHCVEGYWGGEYVDDCCDHADEEWIVDGSELDGSRKSENSLREG